MENESNRDMMMYRAAARFGTFASPRLTTIDQKWKQTKLKETMLGSRGSTTGLCYWVENMARQSLCGVRAQSVK